MGVYLNPQCGALGPDILIPIFNIIILRVISEFLLHKITTKLTICARNISLRGNLILAASLLLLFDGLRGFVIEVTIEIHRVSAFIKITVIISGKINLNENKSIPTTLRPFQLYQLIVMSIHRGG